MLLLLMLCECSHSNAEPCEPAPVRDRPCSGWCPTPTGWTDRTMALTSLLRRELKEIREKTLHVKKTCSERNNCFSIKSCQFLIKV